MDWLELIIKVPVEYAEITSAVANMVVPYGIYIEDYSDLEQAALEIANINLIDKDLVSRDRKNVLIHIYISTKDNFIEATQFVQERLKSQNIPFEINQSSVREIDWADNWKRFFKVTDVGNRLVIRPTWETYNNLDNKVVINIDPGAAFGTGTHATTKMCLELLEEYVSKGKKILDIGCGSGILSIAGVLLGADKAIGVDIDSVAVKVSKENAQQNQISNKTEFLTGNLTDKINEKCDIICANIVADAIITLSSVVGKFMSQNAVFICSGIIDVRRDEVVNALVSNGFAIERETECENWHAFAVRQI